MRTLPGFHLELLKGQIWSTHASKLDLRSSDSSDWIELNRRTNLWKNCWREIYSIHPTHELSKISLVGLLPRVSNVDLEWWLKRMVVANSTWWKEWSLRRRDLPMLPNTLFQDEFQVPCSCVYLAECAISQTYHVQQWVPQTQSLQFWHWNSHRA